MLPAPEDQIYRQTCRRSEAEKWSYDSSRIDVSKWNIYSKVR